MNTALNKEFYVCTECHKEVTQDPSTTTFTDSKSHGGYPQPLEIIEVPTPWGVQLSFNFNPKDSQ
jgi:hypothetical protein